MQEEGMDDAAITSWIADWVLDFAAPCYGPRGQSKLIDHGGGEGRILKSGASALRESGIVHPDLQPYVELAAAVQEHAGDQATGALLLAARLVRNAMEARTDGVPAVAHLDGYALALRQARATLAAMARPDPDGTALRSVVPGDARLAPLVLAGLREIGSSAGVVPLDSIDVRAEDAEPQWLAGVVVEPRFKPRAPPQDEARVLLLRGRWRAGPWRQDFAYRMRADVALGAWTGMEDARRTEATRHALKLGATLVVASEDIDPDVAGDLARSGVLVCTDAPLSMLDRLEKATGARRVPRLEAATKADLGRARLRRRPRASNEWLVRGTGASCTLVVPASTGPAKESAKDDGERLLRAAGSYLQDPMAVPGGGRWQRELAHSLRKATDAAPGKSPLALRDAARALDALADDLARNAGQDPLSQPLVQGAGEVLDVARSVRIAVVAAFEMAMQVLRIDARLRKRESEGGLLRGGDKASLVEAGDVPPLM